MPPRLRTFFLVLLAALFCISAVTLYSALSRRSDIWWTPIPLALSLADSKDRVEIYGRGHPLGTLVEQRVLVATNRLVYRGEHEGGQGSAGIVGEMRR